MQGITILKLLTPGRILYGAVAITCAAIMWVREYPKTKLGILQLCAEHLTWLGAILDDVERPYHEHKYSPHS